MEQLLDLRSAAQVLSVSPSWLYHQVECRKIEVIRAGRKILFRPSTLERWVAAHTVEPIDQSRRGRRR